MKLLSVLHRWVGGMVGLVLAVLGLSGAILVWEGDWIGVPGADDAVRQHPGAMAQTIEVAASAPGELSRITFASAEIGLHQAIYTDGSGAYLNQTGEIVERWTSIWGRPELWMFDLHHFLFAGEIGKLVTGVLGLLGIFFVLSGAILWWRTRRTFAFRLWPARMTRSAIVRQHRDLGVIAAPLLLLSLVTGAAMIFPVLADAVLAPWSGASQPEQVAPHERTPRLEPGWESMLEQAVQHARTALDHRHLGASACRNTGKLRCNVAAADQDDPPSRLEGRRTRMVRPSSAWLWSARSTATWPPAS